MSDILIRTGNNADVPFITNSWLKSYKSADFVRTMPAKSYYYHHHKLLEDLLPNSVVKVACNASRTDQILGWACAQPTSEALVLHFVYVKQPFRGIGVARRLIEGMLADYGLSAVVYTHRTKALWPPPRFEERPGESRPAIPLCDKLKEWGFLYNPYFAFSPESRGLDG